MIHPDFSPIAIQIGPLAVRWYGLMYLAGFITGLFLGRARVRARPDLGWTNKDIDDFLFHAVIGVVVGGRLGYVLFYKFSEYLDNPLHIFYVWEGGMSFHGGFLGVIFALLLFAWRRKKHWFEVTDFVAPLCPLGLGFGRIGNFINAELWGRATDVPWAVVFPQVDKLPRHPSQIYEALLEGLALFLILWLYSKKPRPLGAVSAVFLIGYGIFRFLVEFTREPDDYLGFLALGFTMGQWLSIPMVLGGIFILIWAHRRASPAGR